ncbi:MAG: hypothetical protein ACI4IM_03285 [Acutalibacteraceae bacterium]
MSEFKINDVVTFSQNGQYTYGRVVKVTEKRLTVFDFGIYDDTVISKEKAKPVPPIPLDRETYKKLARYEITLLDVVKNNIPESIVNVGNYTVTISDLLCVLKKIRSENIDFDTFGYEWFYYFDDVLSETYYENTDNDYYNENTVLEEIHDCLLFFEDYEINFDKLIDNVEAFLSDKNKPLLKRHFTENAKLDLVRSLNDETTLEMATEDEVTLYIKFAKELCEKNEQEGLLAVGYSSYGGNRAFPCDWKKSEECMLKLIETVDTMPDQAFYANTLGYIYYYGRCNNRVPEYDKAYKYFSFAAFNQIFEAEYKIADMYRNGYGVPKSPETAQNIICRLYDENLRIFQKGIFNCKFADVAFRLGNIYRDKKDASQSDYYYALMYYYQADFAIRMRMLEANNYGDEKVAQAIRKAFDEAKELVNFEPQKTFGFYDVSHIFQSYLKNGNLLEVKVKEMSYGKCKLTFHAHNKHGETLPKRLFITIPELDMCGMYDSLTVTVNPRFGEKVFCNEGTFLIDEMQYNRFSFDGFPVFICEDCEYKIKQPSQNNRKYRFVSVRFDQSEKTYDYLCENDNIKIGDSVTVPVKKEAAEATVVRIFEKSENEIEFPLNFYKKI